MRSRSRLEDALQNGIEEMADGVGPRRPGDKQRGQGGGAEDNEGVFGRRLSGFGAQT
jgi:hypothetical protein